MLVYNYSSSWGCQRGGRCQISAEAETSSSAFAPALPPARILAGSPATMLTGGCRAGLTSARVPRDAEGTFPHLPMLLISCEVHAYPSGSRGRLSLTFPCVPSSPALSPASPQAHHDLQHKSKASPTGCSSSPRTDALCWVPKSQGGRFLSPMQI